MAGQDIIQYGELLSKLKKKIRTARLNAMLLVNYELLSVYWEIGKAITLQEQLAGWGGKIIDTLAADLKSEFPEMKGLSSRNLRYMRDFALAWPAFLQQPAANLELAENKELMILQQLAAKLPWGHHQVILTRLKTSEERAFYVRKAAENGWSRSILEHQIESGLIHSQGNLVNNFKGTLPGIQNDLTTEIFKDPYNFDFVMLGDQARERDLEDALMTHITKMLLELGVGFAFMGRQKKFEAGGREFFIDLLFYHTKIRRHVIIELKVGEFEPEYVSKMNFYLGLADDQLKGENDEPSIGLILCKRNNRIVAEYALRDTSKPIGIAEYKIAERLPDNIRGELPSIEEIELKIDEEIKEAENPVDSRLRAIREKMKTLKTDEIQTSGTPATRRQLFQTELRQVFTKLLGELNKLKEDFFSCNFYWETHNKDFGTLDEFEVFWNAEENLKHNYELKFQIRLEGFRKAGTENWVSMKTLICRFETYFYAISLWNYNDQQPFIKKLYHQPLSSSDRQQVVDIVMSAILDDIELFLQRINTGQ